MALVISPVAGAWLLHWLMDTFTDGNRYLNTFNIRLFMLASGIKPWSVSLFLLIIEHVDSDSKYDDSMLSHSFERDYCICKRWCITLLREWKQ